MPQKQTSSIRPGLVTFAALMMFTLGGLSLVWAIEEFLNAAWLRDVGTGLLGKNLFLWAISDTIIAAAALFAGWGIWRGQDPGRWVGMVIAILSIIRAFFYIPVIPVGAIVIIIIDGLILYALSLHADYFDSA